MKINTKSVNMLLLIIVFFTPLSYGEILDDGDIHDTFTDQDHTVLNNYHENDLEKKIEDISIKDYIIDKIQNGKDAIEIRNGYSLIYALTEQHQLYFEPILIEHITKQINSETLSYKYEIIEGNVVLLSALYTIGIIRTEKSIDFLLQLIEPVDLWRDSLKKAIQKNNDRDILIEEIRIRSMGSLLQPQDEIGKELLGVIEKKIGNFTSDDPLKSRMEKKINTWEKIYAKIDSSGNGLFENIK